MEISVKGVDLVLHAAHYEPSTVGVSQLTFIMMQIDVKMWQGVIYSVLRYSFFCKWGVVNKACVPMC